MSGKIVLIWIAACLTAVGAFGQGRKSVPTLERAAQELALKDPHLAEVLGKAVLNTSRQASYQRDGTVYVKTGDIHAEWLRDSSAQVRPYLFYAKSDPAVAQFVKDVITRQARYMSLDPYANAFSPRYRVDEERYELDSLCYPIMLAWAYWKVTGDATVFNADVAKGFARALQVMQDEQDHAKSPRHYRNWHLSKNPVGWTGMIWSGFRPSDDACKYNFLIPSEMMAVVALRDLQDIEKTALTDPAAAARAGKLAGQVQAGIERYGIVDTPDFGRIYAYEVDGLGRYALMDDANIPSLLSAPYLGYLKPDDPVYLNTRRFLLSSKDPYFYSGKYASGIGSPHTRRGYVWPLSLLAQDLTSRSAQEKESVLDMLLASDPGDHQLHESFNPNKPRRLSRRNFGWPNALFVEDMLIDKGGRRPLPTGPSEESPSRGLDSRLDARSGAKARDGSGSGTPGADAGKTARGFGS